MAIIRGGNWLDDHFSRWESSVWELSGWEFSGWEFCGWDFSWVGLVQMEIFLVGVLLGGSCPGGNFPGGSCPGGNFPSGSFPGWELSRWDLSWVEIFFGGSFPAGNCPAGINRVAIFWVGVFMLPMPDYVWICLIMPEYGWTCLNLPGVFCFTLYLEEKKSSFFCGSWKYLIFLCFRINTFRSKISNFLLLFLISTIFYYNLFELLFKNIRIFLNRCFVYVTCYFEIF